MGDKAYTKKGQETAQGFEGCIFHAEGDDHHREGSPRSGVRTRSIGRVQRFDAFGCTTYHMVTPGKVGLTEMGTKLANLHLGCVDVEKVLAGNPASQRCSRAVSKTD